MPYNIIFAGTPDVAATVLGALLDSKHTILSVLTQQDRPKGRGRKLSQSPVKSLAINHDIPVLQPKTLKDKLVQDCLENLAPDIMIVVAYGMLLPREVLDIPMHGCLNVHYSLLPRWRGAAPIQRAIEAGDAKTGITIMQMDEGLDTGDMLTSFEIDIEQTDTSASLYEKLNALAPEALLKALAQLESQSLIAQVQDASKATYARKLSKQEARINWHESAAAILRKVHAFNPWPVAVSVLDDIVIRLWEGFTSEHQKGSAPGEIINTTKDAIVVATADGVLHLTQLQMPDKSVGSAKELLNGYTELFQQGKCFR